MRARVVFLLATCLLDPYRLAGQEASPYVPLAHWAMPYVEQLISTGVLEDPTPLTRPLKQVDLVRALKRADTTNLGAAATATIRRLHAEFKPHVRGPRYRVDLNGGLAAATYTVRDPLELGRGVPPRQPGNHGFANIGGQLLFAFGPFVGVSHPTVDTRLQLDPDWFGTSDNATRFAEGYVSGQWRFGELFFGILDRNWGPSGIQGVLLSDNPYSLDHLALTVGMPRIKLQVYVTQLDTRTDSTGAPVNRYMVQHRLWIRPEGRWTVALWEGSVLSGVGRQLELWYLNAATLGLLRSSSTGTNANHFVGADFERQAGLTVFGQFMLDDIQVSRKVAADLKPTSYAFTVGVKGRLTETATLAAFYTQVANLTYRNEDNLQVPLYHSLGTGRNFDDYDQATARLTLLTQPGLLLQPEVTLLRQGQGDPRLPHPLVPDYPATATIFQGVVERTLRLALGANWQHPSWGLVANGGVHLIHNAAHVTGADDTRWVGSLGFELRLHGEGSLP